MLDRSRLGGASFAHRLGVIVFNFASAVAIITINKHIMVKYNFKLIISLTAIHYAFQTMFLEAFCLLGVFARRRLLWNKDFNLFVLLILGIGLSPILSNYSLLFNSVATYQFAKMLQTPSIVFGEFLWQHRTQSVASGLALLGVCAGVTFATVNDSLALTMMGVISALGAILLTTVYKVGTAVAMKDQGWGSMQIMHAVFPVSTAINILLSVSIEGSEFMRVEWSTNLVLIIVFSSVFAFLVSWSQCLVVGACSALAHSLLGQGKTAVVILWAWVYLGVSTNVAQLGGACLSLVCLLVYTQLSDRPKHPSSDDPEQLAKRVPKAAEIAGRNAELTGRPRSFSAPPYRL